MLDIKESVVFSILLTPKSSRNKVGSVHNGSLKLYVTAAPEKGKANKAMCEFLADLLDIPVSWVKVSVGATSRQKRVVIDNVNKADVLKAIGDSNDYK